MTRQEKDVRNARDRERRRRRRLGITTERFTLAPLLAYEGGIDNAELEYRTNSVVRLGVNQTYVNDVEADHLAVALGRLPMDFWPEWLDYDGPHSDLSTEDPCQCFACTSHFARAM